MKTSVYMVRHADSPYVFGEERTRGLSEKGLADARRVAEVLEDVEVACIVSSSFERAKQTVQDLAGRKALPIIEYEELVERQIIGINDKEVWDVLHKAIEQSFSDFDYALKGGESTRKAQERAIPVFEKLLADYRGKNFVVGTHGNIMTIIMNYYDRTYGFQFWNQTSRPDIYKMTFLENKLESIQRVWREQEETMNENTPL